MTPNVMTQCNGEPMFYDTASSPKLPSLYICLARNVLGREAEGVTDAMLHVREQDSNPAIQL